MDKKHTKGQFHLFLNRLGSYSNNYQINHLKGYIRKVCFDVKGSKQSKYTFIFNFND